jgi:hypothetical protein
MKSVFAADALNMLQQWTFQFIKSFEVFGKGIDVLGGWDPSMGAMTVAGRVTLEESRL